jgi:hypothetical protein
MIPTVTAAKSAVSRENGDVALLGAMVRDIGLCGQNSYDASDSSQTHSDSSLPDNDRAGS